MKKRLIILTILLIGILLIPVLTTGCSKVSREKIPDAQILYFSTLPDLVMALKSNKIDAFPNLRMVQSQYMHTDDSVTVIDEEIGNNPAGYVFPKNKKGP